MPCLHHIPPVSFGLPRPRANVSPGCLLLVLVLAAGVPADSRAQPAVPAAAAVTVDPVDQQRREQERERALREQQERRPDVRGAPPAAASAARLPKVESPCFRIDQLRLILIDGDPAPVSLYQPWLSAAAGPAGDDAPEGRCLGAQGVGVLIARLQDAAVAQGYVTTRVLAPPQDLSGGTLVLTVVPGRVGAIRRARPAPGAEAGEGADRGNAFTALPLRPGDVLDLRDVEQGLENLKRVPSAEADIQIAAAAASTEGAAPAEGRPGLSDLLIVYRQPMPFRGSVSLDDAGSRTTGRYQGGLTLSYDNPLTLNDLFYVSLNHDLGGHGAPLGERGTQGYTAHYSLPWGYWQLSATASHNRYRQSVAGASQTYVYSGISDNGEIRLSRIVWRDAVRKTTLGLRAFRRASSNYIDDTEIGVQRRVVGGIEASLNHREFIGAATLDLSLAHKRGTGAFGALPAPEEPFGEGTSRLRVTTLDATLAVPFKAGDRPLRYSATLRTQYNQTPLTPQDRFAIGGRYTVRGFDGESSLSAERGLLLRNELATATWQGGPEAYVALDHGRVGGTTAAQLAGRSLTGAAFGLRGAVGGLQYDVFVGTPLHKPGAFQTARVTAGFSANYAF